MSIRYIEDVPEGTPIHFGPKGGEYFYSPAGEKVYITRRVKPSQRSNSFKPKRGAYLRFIEHQAEIL